MKLIPFFVVDFLARTAAYLIGLWRPSWSYPTERKIRGAYWSFVFNAKGLSVGRSVQFEGDDKIHIGDNVRINDGCQIVAGSTGFVEIGSGSHVARLTLIAGGGGVKVGSRTMISSLVAVYSVQNRLDKERPADHPGELKPVSIGDDVFIGVGAKILPGVKIGNCAVIGAGSVVTKDVPANGVAVGVPARLIDSELRR